jgi:hypothetical protein
MKPELSTATAPLNTSEPRPSHYQWQRLLLNRARATTNGNGSSEYFGTAPEPLPTATAPPVGTAPEPLPTATAPLNTSEPRPSHYQRQRLPFGTAPEPLPTSASFHETITRSGLSRFKSGRPGFSEHPWGGSCCTRPHGLSEHPWEGRCCTMSLLSLSKLAESNK